MAETLSRDSGEVGSSLVSGGHLQNYFSAENFRRALVLREDMWTTLDSLTCLFLTEAGCFSIN